MAELFLAFTTGPGGFRKFVVLKQILPDIASDESFVHMFLDEARITAALNHPNVGQVYELGEEEGQFYLAMEYISGQNLEHIIRRAAQRGIPLPIGFSIKVMRDVCLALNYAHNFSDLSTGRLARIVHRDISPKNIMVTYAGTVKVVDFGIAKARNRLIRTRAGMVKGTSGYMSPEQVRNTVIDGRTDLFASAVILHELLTGQRLFLANTDLVMMQKIAEEEIPHPQKLNPRLSDVLSAVVMKGLERNLRERFQSGGEMARALEKAYPNIADESKTASFMSELFPDKMSQAQALLESAGVNDSQELYKAVRALREDPSDAGRRSSSRNSSNSGRISSSPHAEASSSASGPSPAKSGQAHRSKRRSTSSASRKQAADGFEGKTPVSQQWVAKPSPVKRWGVGLGIFGLLGVLVWAVVWGPFQSLQPYAAKTTDWVKENVFQDKPVAEVSPPANPDDELPEWVIERRAEQARLASEREAMREYERRLDEDPEFQKILNDIDDQVRKLAQMEEEQRALREAMKEDRRAGSANTRKIADLEKKIAALSKQLNVNRSRRAQIEGKPIQVVDDAEKAAQEGLGYFSLSTSNPTNARVYLKSNLIGTTPLVDVLIEEGMQGFHLIDSDGQRHLLALPIVRGQKHNIAMDIKKLPLVVGPR